MNTKLLYKKVYNLHNEIIYSIVIPIFNQETIIADNLESIINNTKGNYEIIIILDFCFDNTENNLMEFLNDYKNVSNNFIQITILKNEIIPLFETKCDKCQTD
jgi:glycosyltransferase involved in cell wall biosynthesis